MPFADITFHPSWWSARGFCFNERFFLDSEYRMEQDRAMRRVLFDELGDIGLGAQDPKLRPLIDSDLLAGEFVQAQIVGCEVQFSDNSLPYTPPLHLTDAQLRDFPPIDLVHSTIWQEYERQFSALFNRFGYVESYMDMHGVQNLALDIRGQLLFEDYYLDEETAQKTLEIAYQAICAVARAVKKYTSSTSIGVTSIVRQVNPELFVTSNCSCELVSKAIYEQFLLPYDQKLAAAFRPFGIHHCGQTMEHLAQAYATVNPSFIEIGAFSDIEQTLRRFERSVSVNLRYSPRELMEQTPSEITAQVLEMRGRALPFKQVSTSCVGIDSTVPKENIKAFLIAAKQVIGGEV